ncbi:hypothetical protein BG09_1159 [Bacillus thuringiensis serovar kurstaki str. HD-1]|nr:hypothetical protein HD73_0380 [Bacillus thuringiensis serovar kurstaki str. HD73]KEH50080.1 hypothetical protein BG09_1159 [Bacillus thuringiensis serovar kurstaki str. HD-1]
MKKETLRKSQRLSYFLGTVGFLLTAKKPTPIFFQTSFL